MARKRSKSRTRLWGIVAVLVVVVCGYCALSTVQERYGYDFGLPQVRVPLLDRLFDKLDGLDRAAPTMDNALAVSAQPTTLADGELEVHFLDVGQAESILILAPGATVLIDGGDNDPDNTVLRHLRALNIEHLDLVIGTHPHADHIGGLDQVIDALSVGAVILPEIPDNIVPTTNTYLRLLESIEGVGLSITPAQPGDRYDLGGGATLTLLAPLREYDSLNDMSVVCRLEYGETSFLFTGDAESPVEADLLAQNSRALAATVLSVGHHGSNTSSTQEFLDVVHPAIAVISCGLDNSYGHPHREVVSRLEALGARILRTDLQGTVVLVSDGQSVGITTER